MPFTSPASTTSKAPILRPPSSSTAALIGASLAMVATSEPFVERIVAIVICRSPSRRRRVEGGLILPSTPRKKHKCQVARRRFEQMTIHADRQPVLRVVPGPGDINANGHIFGGWVLSQMDIAAGIIASRRADGPVATVAIERMEFIAPIHLRDLISVYAEVERVGRTSMGVKIEVVAERDLGATEVKVTEALFPFAALDANHRPRRVDSPA